MQAGTLKERAKRNYDRLTRKSPKNSETGSTESRQENEDAVHPAASTLTGIARQLADEADSDENLQATWQSNAPYALSNLFNYTNDYWDRNYSETRVREEMEIYEYVEESSTLQGRDVAVLDEPDSLLDDFY